MASVLSPEKSPADRRHGYQSFIQIRELTFCDRFQIQGRVDDRSSVFPPGLRAEDCPMWLSADLSPMIDKPDSDHIW